MRRAARFLAAAEDGCAVVLFWALTAVVFLQFFTRYALNSPLGWTEELARYMLVTICYLGSAVAVREGAHIRMELLENRLPPRAARILRRHVIGGGSLVMFAILTWLCADLALRTRQMMVSMPSVPLQVYYWPIFACLAAMSLRCAVAVFAGGAKERAEAAEKAGASMAGSL